LSLFAAFVFSLLLGTGEVGRGVAAGGLVLSLLLFAYEKRRVHDVGFWAAAMGPGCASGLVLALAAGKMLDLSGLLEIWDGNDELTLTGIVTLWSFVGLGMGLSAAWHSRRVKG
jgi:hypothetical protein